MWNDTMFIRVTPLAAEEPTQIAARSVVLVEAEKP
jgi:hypothetical protein